MPSVRLENNTVHFVCSVRKLYEKIELTDCIVATRGGLIHCHKIIFAVYCPYLKKLLMDNAGITTLDFKEVEYNMMKLVLDLMYYGEAEVQDTDVTLFTETAKLLGITAFTFTSLNLSETFPKSNSILYNNAPTCCVNLWKDKERNLPILKSGVVHNQDVHHEREAKDNSCMGNIDLQSISSPEAEEINILKQLSGKVNNDHSKGCIQNSCDKVKNEKCAGDEDLQEELNPFTFIAVPSLSVKCEEEDDDDRSDRSISVSFKSEQEFLSELQIKSENEEKIVINGARMGHSCSNDVPLISETEPFSSVSSASVKDEKLIDNEPMGNSFGISCLNDECIIEGTNVLEVKFESVCEISENNLKEEKSFNTDLDIGNTEDVEPMLLNQNRAAENYKVDASIGIGRQDLNEVLDGGCTSKFEMKEASVLFNSNNSLCANNKDNKYSAMYETPASTSVQTIFCAERKKLKKKTNGSDCYSHNDESVASNKQINFQPFVRSDPLHLLCKPQFRVGNDLAGSLQTYSTNVVKFSCNVCCESFREECHLRKHMRTHTLEKQLHCKTSKNSFYRVGQLAWHMRTPSGVKPCQCPICNKTFRNKYYMPTHMRTHTGHKPFECDVCKKSFSRKAHVNRHMRMHTDERPFECKICTKSFSQKGNLNVHMRIHTGDRPFECDMCHKSYYEKRNLIDHMRKHSGN